MLLLQAREQCGRKSLGQPMHGRIWRAFAVMSKRTGSGNRPHMSELHMKYLTDKWRERRPPYGPARATNGRADGYTAVRVGVSSLRRRHLGCVNTGSKLGDTNNCVGRRVPGGQCQDSLTTQSPCSFGGYTLQVKRNSGTATYILARVFVKMGDQPQVNYGETAPVVCPNISHRTHQCVLCAWDRTVGHCSAYDEDLL